MASSRLLLMSGYIRHIDTNLSLKTPFPIIELCASYLATSTHINRTFIIKNVNSFWPGDDISIELINITNHQRIPLDINTNLDCRHLAYAMSHTRRLKTMNAGMCYVKDFEISTSSIRDKLLYYNYSDHNQDDDIKQLHSKFNLNTRNIRTYSAIFHIGGCNLNTKIQQHSFSNLTLFDEGNIETLYNKKGIEYKQIPTLELFLPDIVPRMGFGATIAYSKQYGIVAVPNFGYKVHILDNTFQEWQCMGKPMNFFHFGNNIIFLNVNQLFVSGGNKRRKHCAMTEIYSFDEKQWIKCKPLRESLDHHQYFGICNDNLLDRVYVGGGEIHINKKYHFFNLHKNEWYSLPNTQYQHNYYPILWLDDVFCLYVVGNDDNGIGKTEMIDLRCNNKKWMDVPQLLDVVNMDYVGNLEKECKSTFRRMFC